jgi:hypothetical protein
MYRSVSFTGEFSPNTYQSQGAATPSPEKKGNKYVKFAQARDKYLTICKGGRL